MGASDLLDGRRLVPGRPFRVLIKEEKKVKSVRKRVKTRIKYLKCT